MSSYNKSQEANRYHGPHHAHIAKRLFFAGVVGYNVGDDTEAWEDEDVDFRMAEESE